MLNETGHVFLFIHLVACYLKKKKSIISVLAGLTLWRKVPELSSFTRFHEFFQQVLHH